MIFQSFILGNLVSLCMKIIHSAVMVGLYYGFITTFSIGPSYLFLLRAQVMEEGTEKKVSATTGFITGQFMIFISIYYAPLHLALSRPHTITVLAVPYLLFQFFWKNHKHFFDSGSTTRNSMRNFNIQCVFLNNLIFQLFNHFILPSSMLARLVKIYMFRCNNKMLFVTSSFVGWLIGHILFMKWLGLVLVWIRQNHSIRSNKYIRSNNYFVLELRNSMTQVFSILLFITCVYYLGRIPSPILTKKLKETQKVEERVEKERAYEKINKNKQNTDIKYKKYNLKNIEIEEEINENKDNIQKTKRIFEESYQSLYNKKEKKNTFFFEKVVVIVLFNPKRWNRPLRYIENKKFDKAVRNEMSQYFFAISKSDGKERICFMYPPMFKILLERIKNRLCEFTLEKYPFNKDKNSCFYFNNEKKVKNLNIAFINRIKALEKEYTFFTLLEKKPQLCNNDSPKKHFFKNHDPLFNGSYRRAKNFLASSDQKLNTTNLTQNFGINKIHRILFKDTDLEYLENKKDIFDKKVFSKYIFDSLILITKKFGMGTDSIHLKSTKGKKFDLNYFVITTNNKTNIITKAPKIQKQVPRWLYKLISELQQQSGEHREKVSLLDYEIRSRKAKRVVILTTKKEDTDSNTTDTNTSDETNEVALIRYSQQPDFRRGIIKGSIRAQRRKIVIWELFQANVLSPIFLERIQKKPHFSFYKLIKKIFRNWLEGKDFKNVEYIEEEKKEKEANDRLRIEIAEAWDTIPLGQIVRGIMLLTQSIFRKYIILPLFILTKNLGRILLFQRPEWSEDLEEWNREMYVKCTYNGVPLSETEFPKNWLTDGIQIKIVFPFEIKPWHKSQLGSSDKIIIKNTKDDFCFLTIWGMESEFPFGSARKRPNFFKPIFKEFEKKKKLYKDKIIRFLSLKEIFKSSEIKVIPKINYRSQKLQKREIIQRKNRQLIYKLYLFFKLWFERMYKNISLYTINFCKNNIELFLEATEQIFDKSISNNKRKKEIINKKKNDLIPSISPRTRKCTLDKSKTMFYDISYVSQAYVFFKLSQFEIKNAYQFVHQYKGIRPFVKKDYFARQGILILPCKLKHKKLPSYELTEWKKWLREHYQYDLSEIKGSGLIAKKQLNRVHQRPIIKIKKENLSKWNSNQKDQVQLIPFKKQFLLYNEKENFEKYSNYDLLTYKFINYEKEYFFYRSGLQGNKNQDISLNKPKETVFKNRTIFNVRILYMKRGVDKKYFDCEMLKFDLRQKNDIETWLTININNTQFNTNNYKKIPSFFKLPEIQITNYQKGFFDWIGMNTEKIKGSIVNPEPWFFSEFIFLYKIYKKKPWFIPSKLILLNWNINEKTTSENKKINEKNKVLLSSKKKNPNENEPKNRRDLESVPSQKNDIDIEENSTISEEKKPKQYKSKIEAELDLFLKRYLIFQLRGNNALTQKMISNIKAYCLLLKLMDPKRITLSSIQKRELNLDIMLIEKNLTLKELINRGVFVIEPICLSGNKDGEFIMYQTVNISLVHKSKHQTNKKNQEKRYLSKSHLDLAKVISPHQRIIASINKNFYLLIPENILSPRRCRTLRICIYLNSKDKNLEKNTLVWNGKGVKSIKQVSHCNNDLNTDQNQLMQLKGYIWPYYRLEDLACMNRYWFNTTNGSRLNMLRLQFYSQLKTRRY
nr:hypothetical chloroplast RF19 [Utricularia subulata]